MTELHMTSLKPKQPVYLFLFSDSLLVSVKKKNLLTGKSKLVADRAWILNEIEVKDGGAMGENGSVIKITKGPDSFLYRIESGDDKRIWLTAIRKCTSDLIAMKKNENQNSVGFSNNGNELSEVMNFLIVNTKYTIFLPS